jgi:hypothetical protein
MLGINNQGSSNNSYVDSKNNSEIVNGTSSNATIANQYIVTLQNDTTDNSTKLLIKELEEMGGIITGQYNEIFKGFSFKTNDNETAEKIVNFLNENPIVQSLTPDRVVSITPENKG